MGCFSLFPCFTSSKHHHHHPHPKPNKSVNSSSSADQGCKKNFHPVLNKVPTAAESTNIQTHIPKSRDNNEVDVICDSHNKTVLDVGNHKDISTQDVEILSVEESEKKTENEKLGFLMQSENERKEGKQNTVEIEDDNKIEVGPKPSFGVHMVVENQSDDKENEMKTDVPVSDSSVSSYISYPPMHIYHNLATNEDDQVVIHQESSESLFSLSVNPTRQSKGYLVDGDADDKEVNSPLKISSSPKMISKPTNENVDHNQAIDSLLNPIENLAQWKTLKSTPSFDLHQEKENLYLEKEDIPIPVSEDPTFKVSDMKGKMKNNTAVTTSLSSWLVDSEKSITVSNQEESQSQYSTGNSYAYSDEATSWKSFEDRPILGAWTIDEVKQISARSSPRKSPCRSPEDTPIIGTVGSYWSHTMQTTDSSSFCTSPLGRSANSRRNKVNKAISCHSSPTKRRLERAFNKSGV